MPRTLEISHVPDALYAKLERNAAARGVPVADYVLQELDAVRPAPDVAAWETAYLALAQYPPLIDGPSSVQLIHEGRAERDAELSARLGIPPEA